MMFIEFPAVFRGDYSKEDRKSYTAMYGDNQEDWPDTDTRLTISLNIHAVASFHDLGNDEYRNHTTVVMAGTNSYLLDVPYKQFKKIIEDNKI